jgi:hypothetical protein
VHRFASTFEQHNNNNKSNSDNFTAFQTLFHAPTGVWNNVFDYQALFFNVAGDFNNAISDSGGAIIMLHRVLVVRFDPGRNNKKCVTTKADRTPSSAAKTTSDK